jgi:hypothetical protein
LSRQLYEQRFAMKSAFRHLAVNGAIIANDILSRVKPAAPIFATIAPGDLYLSPHYDDVCFSIGSFVSRRRSGALLTIFSRSDHLLRVADRRADGFGRMKPEQRIEFASRIRRDEDLAFAERVGLDAAVAGLDEAPIRNRHPFDSDKSIEDAARLERPILDSIAAAAAPPPSDRRAVLCCPMGIGGHVDHLTLLRIVRKHYADLHSQREIVFYEDLHYASTWDERVRGVARFGEILHPLRPRRRHLPVKAPRAKLELVNIYKSQFRDLPDTLAAFSPATFFAGRAHEALWTIEPS